MWGWVSISRESFRKGLWKEPMEAGWGEDSLEAGVHLAEDWTTAFLLSNDSSSDLSYYRPPSPFPQCRCSGTDPSQPGQVGRHKPSLLSLAFSEWWAESGLHFLSLLLLPPQHTRENIQNVLTVTAALQFQR